MKLKTNWAEFSAFALVALLTAAVSLGQTKPSDPAPATAVPFVRTPIPEIAKLSPIVSTPTTAEQLAAIQTRVETIARFALPAIVNVRVSDGQGSGVIISKDGYVLTAGHVSGKPNVPIDLVLCNGTTVKGITLGANNLWDSGLCKITTPGEYPFMPIGSTAKMAIGQWVVAMGHPGGWEDGRPPVLRLGKTIGSAQNSREWYLQTDCPLIMGDSGGPVFDLDGEVIGINSRIGIRATSNVHVPIDAFTQDWDRLVKGEQWGKPTIFASARNLPDPTPPTEATLSLSVKEQPNGLFVNNVMAGKASEKAGVQPEDILTKLNGQMVKSVTDVKDMISKLKPGQTVTLELLRQSKPLQVKVILDAK